jgi:hypothetical protein
MGISGPGGGVGAGVESAVGTSADAGAGTEDVPEADRAGAGGGAAGGGGAAWARAAGGGVGDRPTDATVPGAGVGAVETTPPARSTIGSPHALHFSRYAFPGAGSAEDAYFFPHFGQVNRTAG